MAAAGVAPAGDGQQPATQPNVTTGATPDATTTDAEPDATTTDAEPAKAGNKKKSKKKGKSAPKHLATDATGSVAKTKSKSKSKKKKASEPEQKPTFKDTPAYKALTKLLKALRAAPGVIHAWIVRVRDFVVRNHRKPLFITCEVLLGLYVLLSLFFSWRYLPGTTINGRNASLATARSIAPKAQDVSEYEAQVQGMGISLTISSDAVGLSLNDEAFSEEASTYLPSFAWPLELLLPRDYEVTQGITYSKDALEALLSRPVAKVNVGSTQTKDATIHYDSASKGFEAIEEQQGDTLDLSRTADEVAHGLKTLQEAITIDDDAYVQPATKAADARMQLALHQADELSQGTIRLLVDGTCVYTIKSEIIRPWIVLDDSYGLTGDLETITTWTEGRLSQQLDTVGTTRTYTRTDDGKRIEVAGGTYGWVIDGAKLAKLICERIEAQSLDDIEVPMSSTGVTYVRGGQDWGNRYVDIDLSQQYVRMFDENSTLIWASECVTGNTSEGHDTVVGVFSIQDKEPNATLTGLDYDSDGEPDYESKVGYWMPFYGGYGLHDALWRDYFGYDAYMYDGSHGCVNLPYYAAQELFSLVELGDPVIVHW